MVEGFPLSLIMSRSWRTEEPMQFLVEYGARKLHVEICYGYVHKSSEGIPVLVPREGAKQPIWFPGKDLVKAYSFEGEKFPEEGRMPELKMLIPPKDDGIVLGKLYCGRYLKGNRHHKSGDPFFRGLYSFPNEVELSIDSCFSYGRERHEVHDIRWSNQNGEQNIQSFILTKSPIQEEALKAIIETPEGRSVLVYDGKNHPSVREADEVYKLELIEDPNRTVADKIATKIPKEICSQSLECIIKEVLDATASNELPLTILDYLETQRYV